MNNLINQLDKIKQQFNMKLGKLESLKDQVKSSNSKIAQLELKEDQVAKASLFLQSLSDTTRIQVIEKIAGIVTDALQTVKDKNLVFQMNLVTKNNQPTLEMGILDKLSGQTYDILQSMGGGVADLVSVTLRIALLCRWQPNLSRVIIMDEVGKFISVKDQEIFSEFIRKLSEALNLQLVWISHSNVLTSQAHKIFEVTKHDGLSKVEEKTIF